MYQTYLFLLAGEMPDTPTHVFEAGTPFSGVSGSNNLDPCPMEISLVDTRNDFFNEVLRRIEINGDSSSRALFIDI